MLAHKYDEKRIDWSEPVYIQPKLDGVRCLFTKDGAYSRTGKKFMNLAHIELALIPFFKNNLMLYLTVNYTITNLNVILKRLFH